MRNADLVSVYITTRNRSALLRRAIDSVLGQTHSHLELLIYDDASEDDTPEVVQQYTVASPRIPIRYLRSDIPRGAPFGRNICLKNSLGRYITGLDDDDFFHPRRIEVFIENYEPSYSCLAAMTHKFSENKLPLLRDIKAKIAAHPVTLNKILYRNVLQNQVFIEADRLKAIGGFDETLQALQDRDTWTRAIRQYGPAKLLDAKTYYIDVSRDRARISTSERKITGLHQYLENYRAMMSDDQKRAHLGTLLYLTKSNPSLLEIFATFSYGNPRPVVRLILRRLFRIELAY